MAKPAPGWVEVGGARLEVLRIPGAGPHAPTLVFLHEALGSVSIWRDFPQALCRRTGAAGLVYSRQGHGQSDPFAGSPVRPADFHHREAWIVLPELLRKLAIERPYLVGHSDGATITLLAAARLPLLGCAAMAPHVFIEELTLEGILAAERQLDTLMPALGRHHRDPAAVFAAWRQTWLLPEFRGWNVEAEVREIAVPTLLIQGEDDQYGSLRQLDRIERAIAAGRPGTPVSRRVMAGVAHVPWKEAPQATLDAIAGHLAACLERTPG